MWKISLNFFLKKCSFCFDLIKVDKKNHPIQSANCNKNKTVTDYKHLQLMLLLSELADKLNEIKGRTLMFIPSKKFCAATDMQWIQYSGVQKMPFKPNIRKSSLMLASLCKGFQWKPIFRPKFLCSFSKSVCDLAKSAVNFWEEKKWILFLAFVSEFFFLCLALHVWHALILSNVWREFFMRNILVGFRCMRPV